MASERLSQLHSDIDEDLPGPAVQYLDELARALPGPRRLKAPILDEVSDGMVESVAAHRLKGEDSITAAHSAVAEFGDVEDLAKELSREMAGSFAHHLGLGLIATGPVIGLGWLSAFALRSDDHLLNQLQPLLAWLPGYGLLMTCVVATAVLATTAGGGPISRLLSLGPCRAAAAAVVASIGCIAIDAMLLTHLLTLTASGHFPMWLAVIPAVLSASRLVLVALAAHRCSVIRSAAVAI